MPNPIEDVVLFSLGPFPVSRIVVVTWCVMGVIVLFAAALRLKARASGQ